MYNSISCILLILALDSTAFFWQFGAKICLLTSFRDTCFIEIMPQHQAPKRGKTGKVNIICHIKFYWAFRNYWCISRSCKLLHILLFPYRAYLHNQPVVFFPRLENWACIWSFCTLQDVNRMIVFPIKSQKPVKCEWDWVFNCWAYSNNFYWK